MQKVTAFTGTINDSLLLDRSSASAALEVALWRGHTKGGESVAATSVTGTGEQE